MGWIEKKVGKNLGSEQKSAKNQGKWTKGVRAIINLRPVVTPSILYCACYFYF